MLAAAALVLSGTATAIGKLAPWWPTADIPNHFTPQILVVCASGIVVLAFDMRRSALHRARFGLMIGLFAVAAINAMTVLRALATTAQPATEAKDTLSVVSFNVWSKNEQIENAGRWLAEQKADVIVLEEMTPKSKELIGQALAATHPYVYDCGCNEIVMYSRRPWTNAGGQQRTAVQPAMSWFTFAADDGRELQVVGVRTRYVVHPNEHSAHYDWLVGHAGKLGNRLILAGDFNAAPWSWQMRRFAAAIGLVRHGTYGASWPARFPLVLIDNVMSTPDIQGVSFGIGPELGSDHLPVVATLALR